MKLMPDPNQPSEMNVAIRDQLLRRVIVVGTHFDPGKPRKIGGALWAAEICCKPTLKAIFRAREKLIEQYLRWRDTPTKG